MEKEPLSAVYSRLSKEQQDEFGKTVIDKLQNVVGVYGELPVLAEYIQVMLQSGRPPDQIEAELAAFLQDQSGPFTKWLFEQVSELAGGAQPGTSGRKRGSTRGEKTHKRKKHHKEKGTEQAAAAPTAPAEATAQATAEEQAANSAAAPVAAHEARPARSRSRRRRRRDSAAVPEGRAAQALLREALPKDAPEPRGDRAAVAAAAAAVANAAADAASTAAPGNAASKGSPFERKAVLTPNVQYLREAYHSKVDPILDREDMSDRPVDTRWHFRAEPAARDAPPPGYPAPPPGQLGPFGDQPPPPHAMHMLHPHPAAPGQPHALPPYQPVGHPPPPGSCSMAPPPPGHAAPGPGGLAPGQAPVIEQAPGPKPKHFTPKKWRVVQPDTVVRSSMHLDSPQITLLQEGEIIEQVAPHFRLSNGIIRLQVRHPSSPAFPNPIGWVTQDASEAGGPKFLEPGPEPMMKFPAPSASTLTSSSNSNSTGTGTSTSTTTSAPWRPRAGGNGAAPGGGFSTTYPPRPAFPAAHRAPNGLFQSLTWKKSD